MRIVESKKSNGGVADYDKLMRDMGSPDGAWNPQPDAQILGVLRDDVSLSPNDSKAIAVVSSACIRKKPKGRTAFGLTEHGKPLIRERLYEILGWDPSNGSKVVIRLLAWGFLRENSEGVLGLGANVNGTYTEAPEEAKNECPKCGRNFGEDRICMVCTYHLPEYLFVARKRLSEIERKKFDQGWVAAKEREAERIAESTKTIRHETKEQLQDHCKAFGLELKNGTKNGTESGEPKNRKTSEKLYVHTTSNALFEHTIEEPVYSVVPDVVQGENPRPLRERKGKESERASSSSFSSLIGEAFRQYATDDDDVLAQLVASCRRVRADCTRHATAA